MRFSVTITYPGSMKDVSKVLHQQDFYQARWQELDSNVQVNIYTCQTEITVTSDLRVCPPSSVKFASFMKSDLPIKIVEVLSKTPQGQINRSTFTIKAQSSPVKAYGTTLFQQGEDGTVTRTITGQVECKVPLVGSAIEQAIVQQIQSAWRKETQVVKRFLQPSDQ